LIAAIDAGASELDELVAASGLTTPATLAALTLLELDGSIEARGPSSYARVATALGGEEHGR
jgi:predicted Rossmann fold nucleotide-binding protein DprA/Smf involved in DNA uptake